MCRKLFLLIYIVSLLAFSAGAFAEQESPTGTNWTNAAPGDSYWKTADNWDYIVPTVGITWGIDLNDTPCIVTADVNVTTAEGYIGDDAYDPISDPCNPSYDPCDPNFDPNYVVGTGTGILTINGGYIKTSDTSWVGFYGVGVLNITSGGFIVSSGGAFDNIVLGQNPGSKGTVNMTGGKMICAKTLYVYEGPSKINLDAGLIKAGSVEILPGSNIDIEAGTLIIGGTDTSTDQTGLVTAWAMGGQMTAYDGAGYLITDFNDADEDNIFTTVTAALYDSNVAAYPSPVNNETIEYDTTGITLSWTPGVNADKHNVYFGTSEADVNASATPVSSNQDANSYGPVTLTLDTTYYWRIDEVDTGGHPDSPWTGLVWSFTMPNYLFIGIEGFADNADMLNTWSPAGDASLSLSTDPFKTHGHFQSMEIGYNNVTNYYSEAVRTYAAAQDWTKDGINQFDFFFLGTKGNALEKLYVMVEDNAAQTATADCTGDANDLKVSNWHERKFGLQDFVADNPSINLAAIKKVSIGVGDRSASVPGGAGTIYVDDIVVAPPVCVDRPSGDLNNDCMVDFKDFAVMGKAWLVNKMFP